MWRRLQWGLITALGYIIVSLMFGYFVVGEINWSLMIGLTVGGFFSGFTYLNPPPQKWQKGQGV
ncbi:hypothetical protein [Halobacillus trueperi]|uniref:Uncharacterized protein n=1 Tax=Halobacillus trueperi TaxID=156205 RepID=A0A3E0JDK5_9BACI|nr:hypothetical protein [Halobacillus trueperi]REJ11002.1 hypothetical protein DYE48_00950 [Halobacillus trueperi]